MKSKSLSNLLSIFSSCWAMERQFPFAEEADIAMDVAMEGSLSSKVNLESRKDSCYYYLD